MFGKSNKPMLGKKHSPETIQKMKSYVGIARYNYIKDRTKQLEKTRIRQTTEWKDWRMKVFSRDKYTCQECFKVGGVIEPHHIIPVRVVGLESSLLFELTNGITLCRSCHIKTVRKESDFAEKYSAIISSSCVGLL